MNQYILIFCFASFISLTSLTSMMAISFPAHSATPTQNDYFYVIKNSCDLRLAPLKKDAQFLKSDIIKSLKNKGYNVLFFLNNKRVLPGEQYVNFTIFKTGGFWKKCGIEIVLRKSEHNTPNKKDKLILKRQTMRSIPRVTPSGKERCTRALRDLLVHLPYCKKK